MNTAVHDIQKNTTLLSALAQNLPNAYISIFNQDQILEFASDAGSKQGYLPLNREIGLRLDQVFSDYGSCALNKITERYQYALTGQALEFEVASNGEFQHHCLTPIKGASGKTEYILCFVQNVTEQICSIAALRESEAHLKMATQLAKIGYWELDIHSLMFTFNDQLLDILKVTPEQLGGYSIPVQRYAEDFLIDDTAQIIQDEINLAIETSDPNFSRYLEHRFVDGLGEIRYMAARYIAVKDNNGRTIKTIGANQDITERKLAEQALTKLLAQTTTQNTRLRDFSFMTSHNIRSSVANLVGLTQILKDDPGNLDYIEMLSKTAHELDGTIKNINNLLNPQKTSGIEAKVDCNLQSALNRFAELNTQLIESTGSEIASLLPSDAVVSYIPAYLDSIIYNLISNAIKYGTHPLSKKIEVGCKQGKQPNIYIRDFGHGINLEKHGDSIFSLGSRFHSNRDGQGLGLYMTKKQIESAGGRITIESTCNVGTTFTVYF